MDVMGAMEDTVRLGFQRGRMPDAGDLGYPHIAGMLIRMKETQMSYGKLCRWLGWAQAAVVAAGGATLDDMKQINMRHANNPLDISNRIVSNEA